MNGRSSLMILSGLDGSNPLGFLAALGVLRCLDITRARAGAGTRPRLGWTGQMRPVIDAGNLTSTQAELCEALLRQVREIAAGGVVSLGDIIAVPVQDFRRFANGAMEGSISRPGPDGAPLRVGVRVGRRI